MDITNTTKEAGDIRAALSIAHAFPGSIERQEKKGQQELVNSTKLPTDGSDHPTVAAAGVVMGAIDPHDPIFRNATLPAGWTRKASDHDMWSKVLDAQGRERIAIFYKAAFYDRSANMSMVPRFSVCKRYGVKDRVEVNVFDGGTTVIHTVTLANDAEVPPEHVGIYDKPEYHVHAVAAYATALATAWLVERYPDYHDVNAYWD